MATLTLACTGGTFLSYRNPGSDLSGMSNIPTCYAFLSTQNENAKRQLAQNPNYSSYYDNGGALLEFEGNNILQYKQINRVVLTYQITATGDYSTGTLKHRDGGSQYSYCENIAAYISDATISQINLNNFKNLGSISSSQISGLGYEVPNKNMSTYQRHADITNLYKSIFAGKSSRFIISTGENNDDGKTPNCPDTSVNWPILCAHYQTSDPNIYNEYFIAKSSAYLTIDYDDVAQPAPTPTYPCNVTLQENKDVGFTWLFNSSTAAGQKSATLQYKLVSAGSWTTVTSSGEAKSYILPGGLPQGSYEWRVAVSNVIDETSSYSATQSFNVIGKPASPVIETPDNCCLTTIRWNATGQDAAEILLYQNDVLLAHETRATTIAEYKPQMFLKGDYSIKVRIKNNADMWSDFGILSFSIDAAGPDKGTLEMIPFDKHVQLNGTTEATNAAIIRRTNGVESIIATAANAIDDTVAGGIEYEYVLRTWNTGGYTDSEPKIVTFDFAGSIIKSNNHELNLKASEEKFLMHEEAISRNLAVNNFVGREYPVIERGEFTTRTITKRFYISREEKPILDDMAKEPSIFYRDSRGNAFKAVITSLKYNEYMTQDYIAEITLLKTAPNEVIINV